MSDAYNCKLSDTYDSHPIHRRLKSGTSPDSPQSPHASCVTEPRIRSATERRTHRRRTHVGLRARPRAPTDAGIRSARRPLHRLALGGAAAGCRCSCNAEVAALRATVAAAAGPRGRRRGGEAARRHGGEAARGRFNAPCVTRAHEPVRCPGAGPRRKRAAPGPGPGPARSKAGSLQSRTSCGRAV
jgi:hypothetical protein